MTRLDVALAGTGIRAAARSRPRPDRRRGRCSFGRVAATSPGLTSARRSLRTRRMGTGFWPTTAAGACSQRPMHGAASTRTSRPEHGGQALRAVARAGHLARQAVADPHRQRRRRALAFLARCRSGDRRWRPRRPRSAPAAFPAASAARCAADRWPKRSWMRCRCSISRSRRRGASPSSCRTSASACGIDRRPLGTPALALDSDWRRDAE